MNCERTENLLSAFLDGDISREDEAAVNAHLAECASCREALAGYRALEDVLVARRDEVPSHERFVQGVFAGVAADADAPATMARAADADGAAGAPATAGPRGVSPAFHRARVIMDAIFSVPGLAAVFSVIIGAMCFHYRAVISAWTGIATSATPSTAGASSWMNQILATYAGDMTQVFIVYGVVTALIVLPGAWLTMRFVQDH